MISSDSHNICKDLLFFSTRFLSWRLAKASQTKKTEQPTCSNSVCRPKTNNRLSRQCLFHACALHGTLQKFCIRSSCLLTFGAPPSCNDAIRPGRQAKKAISRKRWDCLGKGGKPSDRLGNALAMRPSFQVAPASGKECTQSFMEHCGCSGDASEALFSLQSSSTSNMSAEGTQPSNALGCEHICSGDASEAAGATACEQPACGAAAAGCGRSIQVSW